MLRLKIFGRFRVEDDFGNEIPIKSKKARALLAYLALPTGKSRSREELMALLWSDRGDEQARGPLRQALSGLRRNLGDDLAKALRIADDAVSLDPDHVIVDSLSPGDQLLEGLHINDAAFDEWLRDDQTSSKLLEFKIFQNNTEVNKCRRYDRNQGFRKTTHSPSGTPPKAMS